MSSLTATFKASLEVLEEILSWIDETLKTVALSDRERNRVRVALEEAVVNIVRYAYADTGGFLEMTCKVGQKELIFVLKDRGTPFDPLTYQAHPITTSVIEKVSPGGFGILIMRTHMDSVRYERVDPYNILTLRKQL